MEEFFKQVVTMLQTTNNDLCFLDAHDFTETPETGDELKTICDLSSEQAEEKYGSCVYAVVSDNAKNMIAMGRKSDLWHCTCNSHTGNLLAKDIIDKVIASKIKKVLIQFKKSDLDSLVVHNGGTKIKLPGETRWCSYRDSFVNYVNNLIIFKKIAAENNKLKNDVIQIIYDEELLHKVKITIEISNPVCILINKAQCLAYSQADAAEDWLKLELPTEFESALNKRRDMALNKYAITGNFLHPNYRGKNLSEIQLNIVDEFLLESLESDGLDSIDNLRSNRGIFKTLIEKDVKSPRTFWGMAERSNSQLAILAKQLLKIPASSAQLERFFSNWAHVHSLKRNRILSDTSKKLVHVYYSLKIKDNEIDDGFETDFDDENEKDN